MSGDLKKISGKILKIRSRKKIFNKNIQFCNFMSFFVYGLITGTAKQVNVLKYP